MWKSVHVDATDEELEGKKIKVVEKNQQNTVDKKKIKKPEMVRTSLELLKVLLPEYLLKKTKWE